MPPQTPTYPRDAACGRSELPPETWDHDVAGETPAQRQARWNAAAAVCSNCPVQAACYAARTDGGGIRVGVAHPDAVPNWSLTESNSWLGWSALGADLHGSEAGYQRHVRAKTRPCLSCLAWARRHAKDDYRASA